MLQNPHHKTAVNLLLDVSEAPAADLNELSDAVVTAICHNLPGLRTVKASDARRELSRLAQEIRGVH